MSSLAAQLMTFSPLEIIFYLVILGMSIVIHEVSHGFAAYVQGDQTAERLGRLTLNPLKHFELVGSLIVPLVTYFIAGIPFGWAKPVPFNPYNLNNQRWGETLVAAAGPASNFFIVLFFAALVHLTPTLGLSDTFASICALVVLINLGLGLFNLVPIPPLDGSKILFGLLPFHLSRSFRAIYERYSLIILLIFIFFLPYILSPIINFLFIHLTGAI